MNLGKIHYRVKNNLTEIINFPVPEFLKLLKTMKSNLIYLTHQLMKIYPDLLIFMII